MKTAAGLNGQKLCFCDGVPIWGTCPESAVISTTSVNDITGGSSVAAGSILNDGGSAITQRGFCWNTTGSPTLVDSIKLTGIGLGAFTGNIAGLFVETNYFLKAFAINSLDTFYGNEISFTTLSTVTFGDNYLGQGGYVADTLASGEDDYVEGEQHGLISATMDQSNDATWTNAYNTCATLVLNGWDDWYLPSVDELNLMWDNLADSDGNSRNEGLNDIYNIGGFSLDYYWSSTIVNDSYAPEFNFSNGSFTAGRLIGSSTQHSVRCVRTF